jgi:hypothetical protein
MAVWVAAGEKSTCPLFMSLAEIKASPPLAVPDDGQATLPGRVLLRRRRRCSSPAAPDGDGRPSSRRGGRRSRGGLPLRKTRR